MDANDHSRSHDAEIAAPAARQHGVVAGRQLVAIGIGRGAIAHRVACGRLHRVHAGVFAVGHEALSRPGSWMAAVLACGDDAVLSHRSAAALWGIRDSAHADADVTVARQRRRPRIDTHRAKLARDEVAVERGIPVTTPARTLLDLAGALTPPQLERAIHETEYRRLTSPLALDALLARLQGRRGSTALQAVVDRRAIGRYRTRTDFEAEFLALLDAHGLPRPHPHEHPDRRPRGRRRLAGRAPDRRARQPPGTRDRARVRVGPRSRPRPADPRPPRRADHLSPAHQQSQAVAADLRALLAPATRSTPANRPL
jgi:hypothetical protein